MPGFVKYSRMPAFADLLDSLDEAANLMIGLLHEPCEHFCLASKKSTVVGR
ncbi:MAG: hypothetical protein JRD49_11945 [Deltaproteobacteria bacterium]|nr:hypothetical protein [Deltaproteobacteria bacterium]